MDDTRRLRWLFSALYFSEGAPIGFIWWFLPTRLTADGVPLPTVTALSTVLALRRRSSGPCWWAPWFSLFMGATNGCESWAGLAVGRLAPVTGFPAALSALAFVTGFAVLVVLRR